MLSRWVGEVVGTMHIYGISNIDLANKMGVTVQYVSQILNEKKRPADAEFQVRSALMELIRERSEADAETAAN